VYSPKISEELIPVLYKIAQSEQKPMTSLVNELIREELERIKKYEWIKSCKKRPHSSYNPLTQARGPKEGGDS
jgi:hypothetical protein